MVKIAALLVLFGTAIVSVAAQRCGAQGGNLVCAAGKCCSQYGWCDTTQAYCDPATCQPNFSGAGSSCAKKVTTITGPTNTPPPNTPPPNTPPPNTPPPSTGVGNTVPHIDICGAGSGGVSCPGAGSGGFFYRCCSVNGHCGPKNSEQSQYDYCGAGCQPGYGSCDPTRAVPPPPSPPQGTAGPNENCGPIVNKRCAAGLCCSGSNYCGTGTDFCGAANWCQANWGTCNR